MRVIQCIHGHYYDADKYEECPTCKKQQKKEKHVNKEDEEIKVVKNQINLNKLEECKNATVVLESKQISDEHSTLRSCSIDESAPYPQNGETQFNFGQSKLEEYPIRPQDDGKTQVGFGGFVSQGTPIQTQERIYHERHNGPVVGWLVAVGGPHKGESFELYTKKNYIGRNEKALVNLYLDNTVSRNSPLGIVYNERKNVFMVIVSDSDQTIYINDDLLLEIVELKSGDHITVGQTILLFVPLVTKEKTFNEIYMMG